MELLKKNALNFINQTEWYYSNDNNENKHIYFQPDK